MVEPKDREREDRHEDLGRGSRREPNWVKREHFFASALGSVVLATLGGGYGVSSIGAKLDAQSAQLTELKLSLTKIESRVAESDRAAGKTDSALSVLVQQVTELRQVVATQGVKLEELERRLERKEK